LLAVQDAKTKIWKYPNSQTFPQGTYVRGFQVDANGNIWDCPRARRQRFETINQGKTRGYIIITGRRQMMVTGPYSIRDYGEVTLVDVDVASGVITRVERSEQVVERRIVQDGVIVTDGNNRAFTPQGEPISTSTDRSEERRIAAFAPVDSLNGMDLRASFQKFIQANSAANSVPNSANSVPSSMPNSAPGLAPNSLPNSAPR
jgi:hypothetical protein